MKLTRDATVYSNNGVGTNQIPTNAIPTFNRGVEMTGLSTTITPLNATSRLLVEYRGVIANNPTVSDTFGGVALFVDAAGSDPAIAATGQFLENNESYSQHFSLTTEVNSMDTVARTFKVKFGPSGAVTLRANTVATAASYGSIMYATLKVTEYMP
jgi:hypothetical protein